MARLEEQEKVVRLVRSHLADDEIVGRIVIEAPAPHQRVFVAEELRAVFLKATAFSE
jgi:hypothetical protein